MSARYYFTIALALLALSLAGAAELPKAPAYTDADYGPLPSNYEEAAARYIKAQLKDPYSAQVRVAGWPPAKMPWAYGQGFDLKYLPVWSVSLMVNARNSFGGYTGEKVFIVYLHKGEPVGSVDP